MIQFWENVTEPDYRSKEKEIPTQIVNISYFIMLKLKTERKKNKLHEPNPGKDKYIYAHKG